MLHICFNEDLLECGSVRDVSAFIRHNIADEDYEDKFIQDMIYGLEGSKIILDRYIVNPLMGLVAPEYLSEVSKGFLMLYVIDDIVWDYPFVDYKYSEWLLKLAEKKDIRIHTQRVLDFGNLNFEIYIDDVDTIVTNQDELYNVALKCI